MQLVTMYYFLPSRESSPKLANPFRPAGVRFCVEMRVACTVSAAGSHQTSHALLISSDAAAARDEEGEVSFASLRHLVFIYR